MNLHAGCSHGAVRRPYHVIQKIQTPCAAALTTHLSDRF